MDYPGGFITKTAPTLNPALGNAAPGVWRLNDVLKNIKAGTWPGYDPYFEYTTLLLHGNGTNGGQNNTFLDSSTNNFTITRNGNTTQGTFSPFSQTGWSNYFDGNGDYITAAASSDWSFTGDFTIECWIFPTTLTSTRRVISHGGTSGPDSWLVQSDGTSLNFYYAAYPSFFTATSALTLNQWQHIAIVRSGSTITIYVNGVSKATATVSATVGSGSYGISIGSNTYLTYPDYYNGYISNLRIVKGTAVYTSAFTPPTGPLTAITNTVFLTCQANRFVDSNTQVSAKTLTPAGNTSVQAFSPFAPTAAYSASTVGGSGYFDGTGDNLVAPDNATLEPGSSDFTIEAWVYPTSVGGLKGIWAKGTSTSFGGLYLALSGSTVQLYATSSGGTWNIVSGAGTLSVVTNAWNHVAVSRSGSSWRMWVNGASSTTVTSSASIQDTDVGWVVGSNATNAENFIGYISGSRIVIGGYVYDPAISTLTIPTAPPTAVTNTKLLLNYTNAAIIDNTAKNVLETVGNAQISTTQSKFGGASMYFDGNGDWLIDNSLNINYDFGSGDFTIEAWIYPTTSGIQMVFVTLVPTTGSPPATDFSYYFRITSGNKLDFTLFSGGTSYAVTDTTNISTNTWTHVAVTRSSGTVRLFRDGTQVATTTANVAINASASTRRMQIGTYNLYGQTDEFQGYIDDLRITKGIARYTSNFTPQTSQWQDQ